MRIWRSSDGHRLDRRNDHNDSHCSAPEFLLACCWRGSSLLFPLPRKRKRAKQVPLAEDMLHGFCRSCRLPLLCTQISSCLLIVAIAYAGTA